MFKIQHVTTVNSSEARPTIDGTSHKVKTILELVDDIADIDMGRFVEMVSAKYDLINDDGTVSADQKVELPLWAKLLNDSLKLERNGEASKTVLKGSAIVSTRQDTIAVMIEKALAGDTAAGGHFATYRKMLADHATTKDQNVFVDSLTKIYAA